MPDTTPTTPADNPVTLLALEVTVWDEAAIPALLAMLRRDARVLSVRQMA